jgi:hypothetical protein
MKNVKRDIVDFVLLPFLWVLLLAGSHWYKGTDDKTIFYYFFDVENLYAFVIFFLQLFSFAV